MTWRNLWWCRNPAGRFRTVIDQKLQRWHHVHLQYRTRFPPEKDCRIKYCSAYHRKSKQPDKLCRRYCGSKGSGDRYMPYLRNSVFPENRDRRKGRTFPAAPGFPGRYHTSKYPLPDLKVPGDLLYWDRRSAISDHPGNPHRSAHR